MFFTAAAVLEIAFTHTPGCSPPSKTDEKCEKCHQKDELGL